MTNRSMYHNRCCSWLLLCLLVLAGCSAADYRTRTDERASQIIASKQRQALGQTMPFANSAAEQQLRKRLLIEQQLPVAGPASLGSDHLPVDKHWPEQKPVTSSQSALPLPSMPLSLVQALQVAAANNRDYQDAKENLYRSALTLDLERHNFQTLASAQLQSNYTANRSGTSSAPVAGTLQTASGGLTRLLKSGISLTTRIGFDLVRMLQPGSNISGSLYSDSSITIPLLRGAGPYIAAEALTQAERNTLYAVWEFERYKREFCVTITDNYLLVLRSEDQLHNQEENYKGLVVSSRRALRLAEAGKLPQIQVDQAVQNELGAREAWIAARLARERALDNFKIKLGLPTDARISLDRQELVHLEEDIRQRFADLFTSDPPPANLPADAPALLPPPATSGHGLLGLDYYNISALALQQRLDLRTAQEQVKDAQRQIVITADALRTELTLFGSANLGNRRYIATSQAGSNYRLDTNHGLYTALLTLDLPFDRTAEAIAYRKSYMALEAAVRNVQQTEDEIKLEVRNNLRSLEQTSNSLRIQEQAVLLADRRVQGTELQLQAGRAEMRDLLEARAALLVARNALTAAIIDYRIAELSLQRDLGILQIDANGLSQDKMFTGGYHASS